MKKNDVRVKVFDMIDELISNNSDSILDKFQTSRETQTADIAIGQVHNYLAKLANTADRQSNGQDTITQDDVDYSVKNMETLIAQSGGHSTKSEPFESDED